MMLLLIRSDGDYDNDDEVYDGHNNGDHGDMIWWWCMMHDHDADGGDDYDSDNGNNAVNNTHCIPRRLSSD